MAPSQDCNATKTTTNIKIVDLAFYTEPGYCTHQYFFRRTPSRKDDFGYAEEIFMRSKGVEFIYRLSDRLKIDIETKMIATVMFHRFYMIKSLKQYNFFDVGAAALLLASKVGMVSKINLLDLAGWCGLIKLHDQRLVTEKEIDRWVRAIRNAESAIFEAQHLTCFDIELPYTHLFEISSKIKGISKELKVKILSEAYAFIEISMRTPIMLFFNPGTVAAAAWWLASKSVDCPQNDNPAMGTLWWCAVDHPRDLYAIADIQWGRDHKEKGELNVNFIKFIADNETDSNLFLVTLQPPGILREKSYSFRMHVPHSRAITTT
ncbi:10873_t:CDS:2 [Acaulospora colombiana]|uniref:10873_t:CDS:1 n=1 Tax=Acaulospora colombiana TaxID=27376 RepID=A0ACA9LVZ9_9GLOM|nr:10873_t:CDS:2 [Acaulospora colombiana]